MGLKINRDDVPEAGLSGDHLKGGELVTRMVYGKSMSMVYAERPADYHSTPHVHDAEQFNYVLEGKIWIFVEDEADLLEPGDFSRVPRMAVHWSKVEEGPCVMVESHSPPYIGDEGLAGANKEKVVGLFTDDETPEASAEASNVWAADSYAEHEDELIASYREEHGEK
ncbi:cupin domain-containing protein [Haloferax sp. YSSS75]|uniref:cupin domain-containing protein n=1 Tax=Haloferax sp. YSSS75 TaxID=3388564 RepID=UPI00398CD6FA